MTYNSPPRIDWTEITRLLDNLADVLDRQTARSTSSDPTIGVPA